jgi:hypothetical protein
MLHSLFVSASPLLSALSFLSIPSSSIHLVYIACQQIDMNPVSIGDDAPYVYKDAIIFSGHKFIGGPGKASISESTFVQYVM